MAYELVPGAQEVAELEVSFFFSFQFPTLAVHLHSERTTQIKKNELRGNTEKKLLI